MSQVAVDLVAGVFGGCAGILAGHPLDTIKVRLQQHGTQYRGVLNCLASIIKQEKVTGLYKGLSSPLVGVAIINSLLFAVYGRALELVSNNPDEPNLSSIFYAGCISGSVNSIFSCPIELVKIQLQNQMNLSKYSGPIDCVKKIIALEGIPGLFKGFGTTLVRETPSYGAYFASYAFLTRTILPNDVDPDVPSPGLLLCGGFAGIVGWFSTYPIDVIKTRIQSGISDSC